MSKNINFVREHRRQLESVLKKDRLIFLRSSIAFGFIAIVAGILLVIHWGLNRHLKVLLAQQESARQTIQSQAKQEWQYLIFVEKLKVLSKLFAHRQGKQAALAFFRSLFDDRVKITGLNYDDQDQQLMFSIRSRSIFSLDQVFNVLKSDQVAQKYPSIDKKGLSRSNNGAYSLQAIVNLNQEKGGS